jgi:hypothetical protein
MVLKLVSAGPSASRPFEPPPFSLLAQPQRPGDLCESLSVEFPTDALSAARAHAAEAGIPLPLWLAIAVEAERALQAAAAATGIDADIVADAADRVARQGSRYDIPPPHARRLASYAEALRIGVPLCAAPTTESPVALRISHLTAAAWSLTAARVGSSLNSWIARMPLAPGRELWEAAAADSGIQLSEWLLLQAARLARSTSAAPHPAA